MSNPAYPTVEATPAEVLDHLATLCEAREHHFWPDSIAIIDPDIFASQWIGGHAKITDAYLLALAVGHGGKLATFDRSRYVRCMEQGLKILSSSAPGLNSPSGEKRPG